MKSLQKVVVFAAICTLPVLGWAQPVSKEQIKGLEVDARSDLYQIGVIMYEMLCGVPPYSKGDHMSVMYQHVQGRARPPIELNPALPQGVSDLIMKCMAVDKEKRFASMDEVGVALERFL